MAPAERPEPTFHEPVAAAQPAPPAALAEPYYYTVDVGKRPHEMLGLKLMVLEQTLIVLRVYDGEGTICHWNKICQNTFPRDQVCAEDMIVRVNGCGSPQTMMNMLQTESDLFIVMCRGGVPNSN
jgi:hypothetical protein